MSGVLPQLLLVGVLILLNAAFAGTELALVSLREGQLQRLEQESKRGAVLARLARDPNRFLATIQVGITLAGFLASAAAAVSLAEPLQGPLGFLGDAADPVSIVVVTLVLAYLTLVFGELTPKRMAMQRAEKWGLAAARPLALVSKVTRPAVVLLSWSTDIAVRLLGGDPDAGRDEVTQEELRELVATQTRFTPQQRLIIDGAFEIADRSLHAVLRPRPDVFVLDADITAEEGLAALARSSHSRAPVADGGDLDHVVGIVHLRDLLSGGDRLVRRVAQPMAAFPEGVPVLDALHELQARRIQMALVVDEHGAASGIVTMEDLIEELVGEIYDETDRDIVSLRHLEDGSIEVLGQFPVHDLEDLGMTEVPDGPFTTVAGLVLSELGRLPEEPGDCVEVNGWSFEVRGLRRRAITEVRVRPPAPAEPLSDPRAD